ncbi:MAG TPA: hypothetical protein VK640_15750 [Actinomycetes bacterium]|nr:hypothetical protein [Actinomycetes bacterium]
MSPSVRGVVTGVAGPAVALGRQGGRVLAGVARVLPVPGRAGLEQAAALTVSAVTGTVATALDVLVPAVVSAVLSRLDLTAVVTDQVDLDAVVRDVDVDAVAARLDIDAVIERMDLTALVRERVDLDAIVAEVDIDAVAARLDIDAVIDRVDLVGLAQEVMDALDLPAIIRGSTASVASESVQDVRLQTIAADEVVTRVVDRLLLRRRHHPSIPDGAVAPLQEAAPVPDAVPVQREVAARSPRP